MSNYPLVKFLIMFLCVSQLHAQSGQSHTLGFVKPKRASMSRIEPLKDDKLLLIASQGDQLELILLDADFQMLDKTQVDNPKNKRKYLGHAENESSYTIYFKLDKGETLESVSINKEGFEVDQIKSRKTIKPFKNITHFILNDTLFSFEGDKKKNLLRLHRSSAGNTIGLNEYSLSQENFEMIKYSFQVIDPSREPGIYEAHLTEKAYWFDNEFVITQDAHGPSKNDLKVLTLDLSSHAVREQLLQRHIAPGFAKSSASFLLQDLLIDLRNNNKGFSLTFWDRKTLDSLKSLGTEPGEYSIIPQSLRRETDKLLVLDKRSQFTKPNQILRKLRKGSPAVIAFEKEDKLELTIGAYQEVSYVQASGMSVDSYVSHSNSYFYKILLDRSTFKNIGFPEEFDKYDRFENYFKKYELKSKSFVNSRCTFKFRGKYYVGFQLRENNKYVIDLID